MTLVRRAMVLGCGAALALVVPLAAPAAAQPSEQDTDWMVAAHKRPLAEIAPGNAALEQASTQQVRDLGQMFVDTHTQVDADLTPRQETSTSTCPTPDARAGAAAADVTANTGEAFEHGLDPRSTPCTRRP